MSEARYVVVEFYGVCQWYFISYNKSANTHHSPSVRGGGAGASTKLETSPCPGASPSSSPSPGEVGVAEGRGPVEATTRTPTGEKS